MRAMVLNKPRTPLEWTELPERHPGPGEGTHSVSAPWQLKGASATKKKAHRVDTMTSSALPDPVALRPTWKGNLIFLLVVAVVVLAVAS